MLPLADLHCHLLAGIDDGPRTMDDALAMCRIAYAEGTRLVTALAHQNEHYPDNTPERLRAAAALLAEELVKAEIPLRVFPSAEVMVDIELQDKWQAGQLLSLADRGQYLLIEMPHRLFLDLRHLVAALRAAGVRPVLAHPERCPELLHEPGEIEVLIRAGCLVQVSTHSITEPKDGRDQRALKDWFRRGMVHVLGSDGHSPRRRPPRIRAAYEQIASWCGQPAADRIASTHGMAILQGLPLRIPAPTRKRQTWFSKLW